MKTLLHLLLLSLILTVAPVQAEFFSTALETAADAIADRVTEVSLHTGNPGTTCASNEVSGNAYARASTTGTAWTESGGTASNNAVIQFATPTGSWGTVSWFCLWAGSTTPLGRFELTTSRSVAIGSDVEFATGTLDITIPAS